MDQRPWPLVLIASGWFAGDGVKVGESVEPAAHQHGMHRRGAQLEPSRDLDRTHPDDDDQRVADGDAECDAARHLQSATPAHSTRGAQHDDGGDRSEERAGVSKDVVRDEPRQPGRDTALYGEDRLQPDPQGPRPK